MEWNRGKKNKTESKEATKKDPKKDRMVTIGCIAFVVVAIAGLLIANAINRSGDHTGEALTPSGSSAMKGRDYLEVVEDFEENGFTNIKTEPLGDLITGWITKEGEVETVTVGGDEDYSHDKWVPEDTEVVISYHTFPEGDEEDIEKAEDNESDSSNDSDDAYELSMLDGATLEEAKNKINEYGYKATYYNADTNADMTDVIDYMESAYWTVTKIYPDSATKTVEVYAELNNDKAESSSDSNTSSKETTSSGMEAIYAWQAAQAYGEQEYPYGFKLHYAVDKLAERLEDADTWFLKAGCTYTLITGVEVNSECEVRVTGTPDNPEITYFVVY